MFPIDTSIKLVVFNFQTVVNAIIEEKNLSESALMKSCLF